MSHDHLAKIQVCTIGFQQMLNDKMKQSRSTISKDDLPMINTDIETFVGNVVTSKKAWLPYADSKVKRHSIRGKQLAHQYPEVQGLKA